ncbi:hypothetical protein [Roseicyclus marinus]|uniref:hypothetical protein n=1 Tax=Roseicyclus marinus TaxID=2161673 RepID=UPI00240EBFF4|nr:hypothetical protein [Roseicyclus marinus]MDG3041347.1 hypothetical protein [Roseicyclus marinus]
MSAARELSRVESLLVEQRRALLAGDLVALAAMPELLEAALRGLARAPVAGSDLSRLAGLAARNAELIGAATGAVARTRASRTDAASPGLGTYDSAGQRAAMAAPGRILARG